MPNVVVCTMVFSEDLGEGGFIPSKLRQTFEWLHSENGSMMERTLFSGGLGRVLLGNSTVELFAFKSMAYRPRLVMQSHIFGRQIWAINAYPLYNI